MAKQKPSPPDLQSAEGYTVLARRYRPQQFADLVGQEPVAKALANALKTNRVAHAYLFTGARGVGKTSCARILAKALNCVNGPTPTPCDQCDMCRSIATGEDVDVLEIDAASNRGIDNIRDLRSTVSSRPTARSRYKIYIIDEVHMLTREAFNALLKTLEEPPPHVKFIFATTEVQKIPITILSRCQRFDFAGIGTPRIVERLRHVVASEGREADDEALELVARRAGGSMRDAQSLLDQLLAFGRERLTTDQVHQLLGTAHDERILDLASAVLNHDAKRSLEQLADAANEGLQLGELVDQLIGYWRDLMVTNSTDGQVGLDLNVAPRHRDTLVRQAKATKLDTILAGLDVLNTTKFRLRASPHGRTLIEMALVRLSRLDDLVSLSQLTQWLGEGRNSPDVEGIRRTEPTVASGPVRPRPSGSVEPPETVKKKPVTAEAGSTSVRVLSAESLPGIWPDVLALVPSILRRQLEAGGPPAISGPNTLALAFPSSYNHQRDHCQEPGRIAQVESALYRVIGQKCQFRVESRSGEGFAAQPQVEDDPANPPPRNKPRRAEVPQAPLVQRVIEACEAQLVYVDEGFGAPAAPLTDRTEDEEA